MNVAPLDAAAPAGGNVAPDLPTPPLARRMACLAYEAMILFGVGLVPGAIGAFFVRVLGAEGAWHAESALRAIAFVVYGVYFVGFWSRGGQTLPMQTWHLRVVTRNGATLTQARSLARYLLAWLWIVPGWAVGTLAGWHGMPMLAALGAGALLYALSCLLHPERQFWHDALAGTRLVVWRPAKKVTR